MRKTLLVSYHFPPSPAIGAQRAERLARLLPEYGYRVHVICGAVGSVAPYAKVSEVNPMRDGLRVRRMSVPYVLGRDPENPPKRKAVWATGWWKLRGYIEYLLLTREWSWNWGQAACRSLGADICRGGFEVMILSAPPNPAVVPFIRLAYGAGIPVVLDFRDLWYVREPSVPRWRQISPSLRRNEWERRLRREALHAADHVVLNTVPMMRAMQEAFPSLPHSFFSTIPNAFGQVDEVSNPNRRQAPRGSIKIAYTGSLAYGRDDQVANLIRGMAEARRRGGPDVELIVAGTPTDALTRLAERNGVPDRVKLIGNIPREDAIKLQRDSQVLLLLQPPLVADVAVPGKIFEYMARRRNILGLVGNGPAGDMIRDHDLGVVTAGESPTEIAYTLARIAERVRVKPFLPPPPEQFSEGRTVSDFAQILDSLLEGRRGT